VITLRDVRHGERQVPGGEQGAGDDCPLPGAAGRTAGGRQGKLAGRTGAGDGRQRRPGRTGWPLRRGWNRPWWISRPVLSSFGPSPIRRAVRFAFYAAVLSRVSPLLRGAAGARRAPPPRAAGVAGPPGQAAAGRAEADLPGRAGAGRARSCLASLS